MLSSCCPKTYKHVKSHHFHEKPKFPNWKKENDGKLTIAMEIKG